MNEDLKTMSSKDLENLLVDVKSALTSAKVRDRREARKAAENAAAEFGFSLGELTDDDQPRRGRPKGNKTPAVQGEPKFRNPDDPNQTWTGKGRKPNWYLRQIENGTAAESMAI